jgi:hypothetical protein
VHVQIDIPRTENEAPSELKRILAQLVLPVSGCTGSLPCQRIVLAQELKQGATSQPRSTICLPLVVNQQRERDASFLAKYSGVVCVAQTDSSQTSAFIAERLFVVAQLRNVLAAKDSAVVTEECDHCRPVGPKRAESDGSAFRVRQDDSCELFTERLRHYGVILR